MGWSWELDTIPSLRGTGPTRMKVTTLGSSQGPGMIMCSWYTRAMLLQWADGGPQRRRRDVVESKVCFLWLSWSVATGSALNALIDSASDGHPSLEVMRLHPVRRLSCRGVADVVVAAGGSRREPTLLVMDREGFPH